MRAFFLSLLTVALGLAAPLPAFAQDEDDRSRIIQFLEEQLSGTARQVSIRGFEGALSSTASLDELTIADDEGIWLRLENAQLEWSRTALFQGELQIDQLTAERLEITRRPVASDSGIDLPQAEAEPFALPELPVSIRIDQTRIERVSLGEPLLGIAAELSVEGRAVLEGGAGDADFDIRRLDGPRGVFDLSAAYDNTSRQLDLSLLLEEAENGLVAELLNLPDRPDLRLEITGSDPIDAFTANIALETDGEPRLTGSVETRQDEETEIRTVLADLRGDISPLILPDYRGFFGDDVGLLARSQLLPNGGVELEELSLRSTALSLNWSLSLAADGRPVAFELSGRIADREGDDPVRLPVPGSTVTVAQTDLDLRYDITEGETYEADFVVRDLAADALSVDMLRLSADGVIGKTGDGALVVSAPINLQATGLSHTDDRLAQALGETARFEALISWIDDTPLLITDLNLSAGDLGLSGTGALTLADNALRLTTDLSAEARDLSRFAAIAGQPLSGSLDADLTAEADLLSGAFSSTLTGRATDLRLSDGLPPALFEGETRLTLAADRGATGLTLQELSLEGQEVTLTAQGMLSAARGQLEAEGRLRNIGLFSDAVSGPVSASVALNRDGSDDVPWDLTADVTGQGGVAARLGGTVDAATGVLALQADGQLPLGLANRAISPRSIDGILSFNLSLNGDPALENIAGQFTTNGARVSLPILQTSIQDLSANGQLSGGRISFNANGVAAAGGALSANGDVNLATPSLPISATITGQGIRLIDPTLYDARIERADLSLTGAASGVLQVSGNVTLGETELRIPETGLGGTAEIPEIRHIGETQAERRTRAAAGLVGNGAADGGSQRIGLDINITAPGRVFIRGRGLDTELGGALRIGGTTANVIPSGRFELVRGRLSILGTRLDLSEGSATLQGSFDPFIRLLATTRSNGFQVGINVIGPVSAPEISFSSDPSLPEDEILAQLLFGRSVSALSPVQLLQMADAAASLAGGSTTGGVFANLREGLGLDDLDIQSDETGNAAVRAGRYISDNVYADVTVGGDEADLSLNIDLTPNITARGTFSADGNSSLGIFYERDY